jgi:hypothetical protein
MLTKSPAMIQGFSVPELRILTGQESSPTQIMSMTEATRRVHHKNLNGMRAIGFGLQNHIPAQMVKIQSRAQKIAAIVAAELSSSSSIQLDTATIEPILMKI